jgi:hypothetical protein
MSQAKGNLILFKQGVLLYSDEELKKSIVDWTKRQRTQHNKNITRRAVE